MMVPAMASRPANHQPGRADLVGEQGQQGAEHGDQRKSAQPGFGGGIALALQADEQADGKTGQELRQCFDAVAL